MVAAAITNMKKRGYGTVKCLETTAPLTRAVIVACTWARRNYVAPLERVVSPVRIMTHLSEWKLNLWKVPWKDGSPMSQAAAHLFLGQCGG